LYFLFMKILIAQTAGFCMGVKRAVDLAIDTSRSHAGPIFTLGPLIHNRQTIDMLKERGVAPLAGDVAPDGATILVRAHGVPPDTEAAFRGRGHVIIDGTCPKVKTVHRVIEKYRLQGYTIVIAGDEGHAEVVGLLGYAGGAGHRVHAPVDVDRLPDAQKICLVSQTTFDRDQFDAIAAKVKQRYAGADVVIKKTICAATDQRQSETRDLARRADAMIVVGGRNSANTMRLADIARAAGKPVQLIETEKEIDWSSLERFETVGVTAGASTPNWMIKRVAEYLEFMANAKKKSLTGRLWRTVDTLANLNIFIAIGATAIYYASIVLQDLSVPTLRYYAGAGVLFLYFLSMYLWNSLASIETTRHLELGRYRFYRRYSPPLFMVSGFCIIALLAASFRISTELLYLMLFATIAGSLYHITIVPPMLRSITRYSNLRDIPTSRDLFVALAWSVLITFVPQAAGGKLLFTWSTLLVAAYVFVLAYLRSVIFDLRDIEGDRIMGRETLVTIIGEKRARTWLLLVIQVAAACLVMEAIAATFVGPRAFIAHGMPWLLQLPVCAGMFLFVKYSPRMGIRHPASFNVLADAPLYLAGFGAWISSLVR
jgi:4-hydroxy-3-methylbut-2-enyl diphosphate reductase